MKVDLIDTYVTYRIETSGELEILLSFISNSRAMTTTIKEGDDIYIYSNVSAQLIRWVYSQHIFNEILYFIKDEISKLREELFKE